jgi:hypothetical protein
MFGPSRPAGMPGAVPRPLLTSARPDRVTSNRSAFSGKPYSRIRLQISPNKNVNFRCASSSSTLETVGNGFVVHGQLTSGSRWASMTFLFVASQLWRDAAGCYTDRASQASFPQSVTLPQLPSPRTSIDRLHLVYCPPNQFPFSYRGLTPH